MEKTIISILKGGSAVIYVLLFLLIFSMPVIFIYQAVKPPVFTFDTVAVEENFEGDEIISDGAGEWQKLQFTLSATAGKFSPYSFYIEEFSLDAEALGISAEDVRVILDEPVSCTKDTTDPFTITLYIRADGDVREHIGDLAFKASDYTKSFGEFKLKFEDGKAKLFKK